MLLISTDALKAICVLAQLPGARSGRGVTKSRHFRMALRAGVVTAIVAERLAHDALHDGDTRPREFLLEDSALVGHYLKKVGQVQHCRAGQVVQHHECPGLRAALFERNVNPAVWITPVSRDAIPENAGVCAMEQKLHDGF